MRQSHSGVRLGQSESRQGWGVRKTKGMCVGNRKETGKWKEDWRVIQSETRWGLAFWGYFGPVPLGLDKGPEGDWVNGFQDMRVL